MTPAIRTQARAKEAEPERRPQRMPEHDQLNVFLGHWSSEGTTAEGLGGHAERITHVHTYRWLPGRFHLHHSWDGHIGSHGSHGIEIIGYDSGTSFVFHFFDSEGWTRVYHGQVDRNTWTLSGPRERCSIIFSDIGHTMTTQWERSPDGVLWKPFCEVRATKSDRPSDGPIEA